MSIAKSISQEIVAIVDVLDLADRSFDVVLDPSESDSIAVKQRVTGTPIAVPRLVHRAHVYDGFALVESVLAIHILGAQEPHVLRTDTGNVRMAIDEKERGRSGRSSIPAEIELRPLFSPPSLLAADPRDEVVQRGDWAVGDDTFRLQAEQWRGRPPKASQTAEQIMADIASAKRVM